MIRHLYPQGSNLHSFPAMATPLGMRTRAVSQDRETARLFAIALGPVFRKTFFIASAVGAIFLASYAEVV